LFARSNANGKLRFQNEGPHPYIRDAGLSDRTTRSAQQTQAAARWFPMQTEFPFTPPKGFKPMARFNPAEPALLHDQLNDKVIPWGATQEELTHWRKYARPDHQEGVMAWDGALIDGWREPPGG